MEEPWRRNQFTFYASFLDAARQIKSQRQRLRYFEAICGFGIYGTVPELEQLPESARVAFINALPNLEISRKRARAGCEGGKRSRKKKDFAYTTCIREKENEKEKENETEIEGDSPGAASAAGDGGFEDFWQLYPVKIARQEALQAWQELPDRQGVLEGLRPWLGCQQWAREGGRFVPRAEKFLRQGYFRQTPQALEHRGARGEMGQAELEAVALVMREGGEKWNR